MDKLQGMDLLHAAPGIHARDTLERAQRERGTPY